MWIVEPEINALSAPKKSKSSNSKTLKEFFQFEKFSRKRIQLRRKLERRLRRQRSCPTRGAFSVV